MGLWCGAEHYKMSHHYVDKKILSLSYEALKCILVHKYTLTHGHMYSRPHEDTVCHFVVHLPAEGLCTYVTLC